MKTNLIPQDSGGYPLSRDFAIQLNKLGQCELYLNSKKKK